ncbi:MAG: hypothetical protein OJF47_002507 [Nitrospira sp.]|jgi:ribosomal protein S12 methylthiotransferase accessory factor|nr:MAG: hypothetical protein OJF47_002507 [Nitrospira sp.]
MTKSTSIERLCVAVDRLVDERVGIVHSVREFPRDSGGPDFFHFYAEACNTRAFTAQKNFGCTGGASTNRGIAMGKAIGEAIERYCSAIFETEDFQLTSYDDAPFACVPPDRFAMYSAEQCARPDFPYVPFTNGTPVKWTPARDAQTGEPWYVPAAMVYMPYFFDEAHGEHPIVQRMSTGLACHCSPSEAAMSAVCEVIERDAMTISWQAGLGMPQIIQNSLSEHNRDLVARFDRIGCSVTLFDLTMDHRVPTILSVFRSRITEAPALAFSAASSLDSEAAVRKSLEELAHTLRLAQQIKTSLPTFVPAPHYDNVDTQDDHVHLYCDHANIRLAEFVFNSREHIDFRAIPNLATGDPETDLNILTRQIRNIGHQVLTVDLTTSDVRDVGLSVIRAIVPGFHPLFLGHKRRALGGCRLWDVPQKLGYAGITREAGDNQAPHPYP